MGISEREDAQILQKGGLRYRGLGLLYVVLMHATRRAVYGTCQIAVLQIVGDDYVISEMAELIDGVSDELRRAGIDNQVPVHYDVLWVVSGIIQFYSMTAGRVDLVCVLNFVAGHREVLTAIQPDSAIVGILNEIATTGPAIDAPEINSKSAADDHVSIAYESAHSCQCVHLDAGIVILDWPDYPVPLDAYVLVIE